MGVLMKKIGIVIAMSKEFDSLDKLLGQPQNKKSIIGIDFSEYQLKNCTAIVARCGIGEIYATSATTVLVANYQVEILINYGFVGALSDKYKIFDMVAVSDIIHYDMDLSAFGNQIGQYDDQKDAYWTTNKELTSQLIATRSIPSERIASADKFVRFTEAKLNIAKLFTAEICDMESAGIAIVANKANIPFASIKLIVDGVSGDSHAEFEANAQKGALCLAEIVYNYISK